VDGYDRRAAPRCVVGSGPTVPANFATAAEGRAAARLGSCMSDWYPFRPSQRHSVTDAAAGTRLRVWDDVLAPLARLANGGCVESDAFALLDWLARCHQIDWSRAVVDSCSVRVVCAGDRTSPNPTDRAKRGSKRHLICDGRGVPLAVRLTGANRNDSQEALALVMRFRPSQGERGRPRCRPESGLGDRGYDAAAIRRGLRVRHIVPWLAMRRTEHGSGLGRWRWVVERTFAWLNQFRRLRVRYDRRADIHEAFLSLGCALICWQSLRRAWNTD
jgi:transposase